MKKTNNKLSKWCKSALMLPAVAVVLTFASCQKDDAFTVFSPDVSPVGNVITLAPGVAAGTYTFDFENTSGSSVFAVDPEGSNLYSGPFPGYKDPIGVWFMPTHTSGSGFASGGIAFSKWNDTLTAGWQNQCSVYYKDPTDTTRGGHNGSENFAVHYGYRDTIWTTAWDGRTIIRLADSTQTCLFKEFYVTNNTYAVRSMEYGDGFAKVFSYADRDWFKLIIDGLNAQGSVVSSMDVYLADFRRPSSPGILKDWMWVDLTSLGQVTAIRFDMRSSDTGQYGLNTPAYFCFDDLTVILP